MINFIFADNVKSWLLGLHKQHQCKVETPNRNTVRSFEKHMFTMPDDNFNNHDESDYLVDHFLA